MFSVRRPREVSSLLRNFPTRTSSKHVLISRADPRARHQQLFCDPDAIFGDEARKLDIKHTAGIISVPSKPRALSVGLPHVPRARSPKSAHLPALVVWHQSRRRLSISTSQLNKQCLWREQREKELRAWRICLPDPSTPLLGTKLRAERAETQQCLQVAHVAWLRFHWREAVLLSTSTYASATAHRSAATKRGGDALAHGTRAPGVPDTQQL